MNQSLDTLSRTQDTVTALAVEFAPKLVAAGLILAVGFFATGWAASVLRRGLARLDLEPPVSQLLERVVRVLVLGLFVVLALQNLGIELLPLIAGLGIAGAGVALAMQGVLSNLAAGLTIIFTRPFRVGEYISIAGVEGQVRTISLFTTVLRHADLSDVVIPNRKISGEILHNYGSVRQLDLAVNVGYDADLDDAVQVVHEVLLGNARVLRDPSPVIQVAVLADSSVELAVKPWVQVGDNVAATGEINLELVRAFRRRGIVIPPPKQEIRLLAPPRE
ncbi:MAG: mechanosensitive ion channel [Gammaproteobacteria bacterium]|nr:mechanosensitive ion channel [Gammaproteobacteria bacterium]